MEEKRGVQVQISERELAIYFQNRYNQEEGTVTIEAEDQRTQELFGKLLSVMGVTDALVISITGTDAYHAEISLHGNLAYVLEGTVPIQDNFFQIKLGYENVMTPPFCTPYCYLRLINVEKLGNLFCLGKTLVFDDDQTFSGRETELTDIDVYGMEFLYNGEESVLEMSAVLQLNSNYYKEWCGTSLFRGFALRIFTPEEVFFRVYSLTSIQESNSFAAGSRPQVQTNEKALVLENGAVNNYSVSTILGEKQETLFNVYIIYPYCYEDAVFYFWQNFLDWKDNLYADFYSDTRDFSPMLLGNTDLRMIENFIGFEHNSIFWFVISEVEQMEFHTELQRALQAQIYYNGFSDFIVHYAFIRENENQFRLLNSDFYAVIHPMDNEDAYLAVYQGFIPHDAGGIEDIQGVFILQNINIKYLAAEENQFNFCSDSLETVMELESGSGEFEFDAYDLGAGAELYLLDDAYNNLIEQPVYAGENAGKPSLKLTSLELSGNLNEKTLYIEAAVDTSSVLNYHIGKLNVTVKEISAYLNYNPHNTGFGISGILVLGLKSDFELQLGASYENKIWTFQAMLLGREIPITEIIEAVSGWKIEGISLDIYRLQIVYRTDRSYFLALGIRQQFAIFDQKLRISVEGEISQQAGDTKPTILLIGQVDIQSFLFRAQIQIDSQGTQTLALLLEFGGAKLTGRYQNDVIEVEIQNLTIGILLKLLFQVWRPNVKFYLSKPWDVLNQVGFSKVTLKFDTNSKDVSVSIAVNINLLAVKIKGVTFAYQKDSEDEQAKFMVNLDHEWLIGTKKEDGAFEQDEAFQDPIQPWDALSEDSPAPLDQTAEKLFRLSYFGIGRYIDLNLSGVEDGKLSGILEKAKESVTAVSEVPVEKFSAEYGWFIGAQFTLLDCFKVSLLFYDPLLYGLEVEVTENEPLPLKGLDLTIYYRKVSEKIGVFYVHAVLPDFIKHMDFGTLSIDLPDVEIWIYTNGNFKINFGFPYERDFSLCFALTYGIFTGKGGFYFGYLNGDTSSQVPETANGYFSPVIELGVGICIQVGKSLNAGILKLSAKLELTGIFTGVFAQFHYNISGQNESTCWYYRCTGYVAIAGEISGSINFYVISVNFRVCARASICLTLEDGEEGIAVFEASFSVSARVKILFITFSFQFSFTWQAEFVLGEKEDRPWKQKELEGQKEAVWIDGKNEVAVTPLHVVGVIVSYFSVENISVDWDEGKTSQEEETGGVKKIAFFLSLSQKDFTSFYGMLAERAIGFLGKSGEQSVSLTEMEGLLEKLQDGELKDSFTMESLNSYFGQYFSMEIVWNKEGEEQERVPLPIPPVYSVTWETLLEPEKESLTAENVSPEEWFCDFILMVTKLCVDKAVQYMKEQEGTKTVEELLAYLREQQKDNICAMVTRAMFCGNRIDGLPMYEKLNQQFNGQEKKETETDFTAHRLLLERKADAAWVLTETLEIGIHNSELNYPREPLTVRFLRKPAQPAYYRMADYVIAMQDCQKVYLEDAESYYLWKPQGDISHLKTLNLQFWEQSRLTQNVMAEAEPMDTPVALLDVTLKRTSAESQIYMVTGASDETRNLLARIGKDDVNGLELLWSKKVESSEEKKKKGAFYYKEEENEKVYLIRQNLSEVTTAYNRQQNAADDEVDVLVCPNDSPYGFLMLLDKVLKTGGEGHYLKVDDEPDSLLFDDEGETTLFLAVWLTDNRLANRIRLDVCTEEGLVPVVVNEELGQKPLQSVAPGYLGYEFTIEGKQEDATPFHLLCTQLFGEVNEPVSMQENEAEGSSSDGFYYSSFLKLPPLKQDTNPYARIIPENYKRGETYTPNQAELSFSFTDIAGNRTSEKQRYPADGMELFYYDNLHALTELPFCSFSYSIAKQAEDLCLSVCIAVQEKSSGKTEDVSVLQNMMDQISMADVVLKAAFVMTDEREQEEYCRLEQECSAAVKEELLSFMRELSAYLSSASGTSRPSDFTMELVLKNTVPKSVENITIVALRSEFTIARDAQFTDKTSKLPNVQAVCSELVPKGEDTEFAAEFEKIFTHAKLAKKDGLYAVFFPEGTLRVTPSEPKKLFYSLCPLSTSLKSREGIAITDLSGKTVKMDYYEIDLEKWASAFFAFYERILAPESLDLFLSGENRSITAQTIKELLERKEEFCDKIVGRMENLFVEGETLEVAKEAQKDVLRKNLSTGYLAAGTAVYKVEGKMSGYALSGQLDAPVGVLGAKITQADQVGFVTAPAVVGAQKEISMEGAAYTFTNIEDTNDNEWYRFVGSFCQFDSYVQVSLNQYTDRTSVKLPIPERQYPDVPVLSEQQASSDQRMRENPVWNYSFTMTAALMAQDTLFFHIRDSQILAENRRQGESADLMDGLADFIYNLAGYEQVMFGADETKRNAALKHFAAVADSVCSAWPVKQERMGAGPEWVLTPEFKEGHMSGLCVEQLPEFLKSHIPKLMLLRKDGTKVEAAYDEKTSRYQIPDEVRIAPGTAQQYIFSIENILLYEYPGMWTELYLKRNARFLGMDANPAFVYTTPECGFSAPVYPFILMRDSDVESYSRENVRKLLENFMPKENASPSLRTELTAYFGQPLRGGLTAMHPVKKMIPHTMTENTIKHFLDILEKEIKQKKQGMVKITVRQYAGSIKLIELDGKIYKMN